MRLGLLVCAVALGGCFIIEDEFNEVPPLDHSKSPCFEANVLDGLSETDPSEMTALYDCLNVNGGFDALGGIVTEMTLQSTRDGTIAALEFASVVNRFASEADVIDGLRQAIHLLQEENAFLRHVVHTLAEWSYGRPWPEVEAAYATGGGELLEPAAVEQGMVKPALLLVSALAEQMLDFGDIPLGAAQLGELTEMSALAESLDTLSRLIADQEADLFDHVAEDFGAYFERSVDTAGHDTLVGLVESTLVPQPGTANEAPLLAALPLADAILDDPVALPGMVDAVGELYTSGEFWLLPNQLDGMLAIDADGGILTAGELDAFSALIRTLDLANGPANCAFIQVDNLSVFILETVAGFDPDDLGTLIQLVDGLVDDIVFWGSLACNGIDPALMPVVPSLTRLAESGALRSLIPLLRALEDADRVPEIVDLLSVLERGDIVPAMAAHGRRVLDGPYLGNALRIVGAYVNPEDPEAQGDLYTILRIIDFAISPAAGDGYTRSPLGAMVPVLREWVAVERDAISGFLLDWAVLLQAEGSQSNSFLDKFAPLLAIDPELDFIGNIGALVEDPEVLVPMLRILEHDGLVATFVDADGPDGREGPLGLIGRFAADGSLEGMLGILVWLADVLDDIGLLPEGE